MLKKIDKFSFNKIILSAHDVLKLIDVHKEKITPPAEDKIEPKSKDDAGKIVEIISEITGIEVSKLNEKSRIIEYACMDSIRRLELLTK